MYVSLYPTKHSKILKPQNPPIDISHIHNIRLDRKDLVAIKLGNIRSGIIVDKLTEHFKNFKASKSVDW